MNRVMICPVHDWWVEYKPGDPRVCPEPGCEATMAVYVHEADFNVVSAMASHLAERERDCARHHRAAVDRVRDALRNVRRSLRRRRVASGRPWPAPRRRSVSGGAGRPGARA